MRNRL